jgi:transposase
MPFTIEQKVFLLECYFRNGQIQHDSTWLYPMKECIREFAKQFPETNVAYDTLTQHIRRLVHRFRRTGCICKGKAPGRKTVLTDEAIERIRLLLQEDPDASWRKLSKLTGHYTLFFIECTVNMFVVRFIHRDMPKSSKKKFKRRKKAQRSQEVLKKCE